MIKIAINGFGRIGRSAFKSIIKHHPDIEIVAVNDLSDPFTIFHLLKYDSVYGIYEDVLELENKILKIRREKKEIKVKLLSEPDPGKLPWGELGVDIVLESTGVFRDYESAKKHLEAGAKKVIISAPSKSPDKIPSFVLGVNEDKFDVSEHQIVDMASCTTNCLAPVAKIINDNYEIVAGFMTTVHSYTSTQRLLDLSHKDLRRARAAALNIIPTTTGATEAIGQVIPELKGKLSGISLRVPTPTVSLIDFVCQVKKETNKEELNSLFKKYSEEGRMKGILGIEEAPLVSSDYRGNPLSSIVDAKSTSVINKHFIKILSWYDNEYGYASRYADFAEYIGKKL